MKSTSAKAEGIFCLPGQLHLALGYPQPEPFGRAAENMRGAAREPGCRTNSGTETPGLLLSVVPTELSLDTCSQFGPPDTSPVSPLAQNLLQARVSSSTGAPVGSSTRLGSWGEQEMGIVHRSAGQPSGSPLADAARAPRELPGGFCPLLQLSLVFKT